ncbi:UvrD-helicase domain-containing protein [Paenibacillus naphthalenovorans]|uniref:UvrD-helicase domain-containing protein n=1 Tax=Paenibacillus naphthalenovorans TaxID=162209 RepID=UPI00088363AA|nr:UvrD-helicase domain-containing protein [Paenibacillus naphthalenovorans]SDJ83999.1 ATP-dependent helicase/nuclease subunit A [Paenibacillus naphthalenovorans]
MNERSDQHARARIVEELNTTFLVEAGAGSGKTTSLVGRLLALIETGTAKMEHIAAITFTNKAADEMKERFRIALERKAADAVGESRERLEEALTNLDQIFIGTIHAFCSSLLRERPIEAGLDPSFEEMDDELNRAFHDQCWDEYLIQLQEEDSQILQSFAELNIDVGTLKDVYDRMSIFTDVQIPCEPVSRPDFDLIRLSLLPMIEDALPYVPTIEPDKGWDKLQTKLRSASQMLRLYDMQDDMQILTLAKLFDAKLDVTQNRWLDKKQAKEFGEKFHDWQITVLFPFLQSWREYLYPKVIRFVLPVLDYCRERRLQAGKLNFQDLLLHACRLLRDYPEVRRYFDGRYQRLMVDEFQDTDPVQAEMMFLLTGTGDDPNERNWRKLTPRPGSLFVVGDPKQSIYRFRRADISIYNEVKARIQACGDVLHLTSNFRSVDSIGAFVNGQFVGKLPVEETDVQAAYVKMETNSPNPKNKRASHGIYALTYPKIPGGKDEVAAIDARRIAAYISWACRDGNLQIQERTGSAWVLRDVRPSDFLILTRTRHYLHLYAEELEKRGVAAETVGSSALYPELHTLGQLVIYLADPSDQVAMLSVLRGPLFGISDAELLQYRVLGNAWSIYRLTEPADCAEPEGRVAAACRKLREYAEWVKELPAWAALYRIMEDTGLLLYSTVQETGANRSGTLLKMLEMLQRDAMLASDWHALADAISAIRQNQGMETASMYAGKGQAVRIMNVHKAKGLEAPIVFLACPCGEKDHDAEQFIDRSEAGSTGYFLIQQTRGFQKEIIAQPVGWEAMSVREREFMHAERDRLLYVAATRAKQMLVVSLYPEQPAKCPWSTLMDGMELIRELDVPETAGLANHSDPDFKSGTSSVALSEPVAPFVDLDAYLTRRELVFHQLRQPTYAEATVTGLTKGVGDVPEWSATGRGQSFGSVIHKGLEAVGRGISMTELPVYVQYLCQNEGVADKDAADALSMMQEVLASELWQRSLRSKQRLFEIPIMMVQCNKETAVHFTNDQTISETAASAFEPESDIGYLLIKGVVDFAFEEEDGWVIVDFKTDQLDEVKLQQFVQYYAPQVKTYAKAWSETFGYPVKEAGLFFATVKQYIKM